LDKAQKEAQVDFLRSALVGAESVVLTGVSGLSVTEVSQLRGKLHEAGVNYKVVKNTLARRVMSEGDMSVLADDFKGPTAIAWSTDAVAPAKILRNFQKEMEKFEIKAGYNAGKRLDLEQIKALAELPSLDELRAQILGTINGVTGKLLAQINAPASNLVGVLQAKIDKDNEAA
jgi:large subunit ribosomal protein L10